MAVKVVTPAVIARKRATIKNLSGKNGSLKETDLIAAKADAMKFQSSDANQKSEKKEQSEPQIIEENNASD